jgi:hypothetical protein
MRSKESPAALRRVH